MRWCVCLCSRSSKPSCQSIHACSAAGIARSEVLHNIGYLLLGLPTLAVRLPLIKAHGLPLRLSWLNETDKVFCRLVGQKPAAFFTYKADYLGSEHWKQLCAHHGLLSRGELPVDQQRGRRRRAQPDAAPG